MEETKNQPSNTEAMEAAVEDVKQETAPEAKSTEAKTYTADEFNNAMASVRKKAEEKVLKKYADVDVEKYNQLVAEQEAKQLEESKARGEFEKVLKDTVSKKDAEIERLQQTLHSQMVDGALLNASSKYKAISPEQVSKLLKENVRLNAQGEVEVVSAEGHVRYSEQGDAMTVDGLVKEWLDQNPHFAQPGPKGAGTQSNTSNQQADIVDPAKLDLTDPNQRALYKKLRDQRLASARKIV
jgi:hypothetical protein